MKKLVVFCCLALMPFCLPAFAGGSAGITLVPAGNFSPALILGTTAPASSTPATTGTGRAATSEGNAVIPANAAASATSGVAATTPCRN